MRVAAHHPLGNRLASSRSQRSVIDYGRYALRDAGDPMTCHPSVTGMPSPALGGIHHHAAIVTIMDDVCNLWLLLAQPIEPPSMIADAPRAPFVLRAYGIAARMAARAGV